MYDSFENLDVWKRSCQLSVRVYNLMRDSKDYSLKDQIFRSSLSIPSNIAEGAERDSKKEFVHFLHISKGSAAELRTQIYIACRLKLIDDKEAMEIVNELKAISKMLHSLIRSISNLKPKT
ncbi:MAG: four helix bundle protein [Victivallales bacterium]